MYTYAATVLSVHDADTLTLDADLGFFVHVVQPFRLLGCNARELAQPGGPEARDHLASLLPAGTKVTVTSVKPDKFGGRWDAVVTLPDGTDLARQLVGDGWAAAWDGNGPKPVPRSPRRTGAAGRAPSPPTSGGWCVAPGRGTPAPAACSRWDSPPSPHTC